MTVKSLRVVLQSLPELESSAWSQCNLSIPLCTWSKTSTSICGSHDCHKSFWNQSIHTRLSETKIKTSNNRSACSVVTVTKKTAKMMYTIHNQVGVGRILVTRGSSCSVCFCQLLISLETRHHISPWRGSARIQLLSTFCCCA